MCVYILIHLYEYTHTHYVNTGFMLDAINQFDSTIIYLYFFIFIIFISISVFAFSTENGILLICIYRLNQIGLAIYSKIFILIIRVCKSYL